MTSNKKRSSLGLAFAVSLGLASTGTVVNASSIADSYATGDTLTAAKMTNIKTAVGDNDARITGVINNTQTGTLKTQVDKIDGIIANTQAGALKTQVDKISGIESDVAALKSGTPTCGTSMTRVGPTCVDNTHQAANQTWNDAVAFCRGQGKRLMTPGEYAAAHGLGTITDMTVYEWVDATAHAIAGTGFTMYVGAVGPDPGDATKLQSYVNYTFDNRTADDISNVFFRCAR